MSAQEEYPCPFVEEYGTYDEAVAKYPFVEECGTFHKAVTKQPFI